VHFVQGYIYYWYVNEMSHVNWATAHASRRKKQARKRSFDGKLRYATATPSTQSGPEQVRGKIVFLVLGRLSEYYNQKPLNNI